MSEKDRDIALAGMAATITYVGDPLSQEERYAEFFRIKERIEELAAAGFYEIKDERERIAFILKRVQGFEKEEST